MCRLTVRTRVTPSYRSQRSARTVKKYEQSKVFTQPMDRRLEDIGEWAKAVFKKDVILVCKGQRVYSLMLSPEALKWDENVQIGELRSGVFPVDPADASLLRRL